MGMPISLALRGRHTDDAPAATAWTAVLADCARRTGCSAPTAPTPCLAASAAARSPSPIALPRWPRSSRSARPPSGHSGGAFAVHRGGGPRPLRRRQGLGRGARRHAPRRAAGHRLLPLRRRRPHLPRRRPHRGALAHRRRGSARPDPAGRGRPRAHRGRRHLRHRPARRPHPRRAHRSPAHRRRVGHRHRSVADRGRHRRHRRLRPRPGRRALAPRPRPDRARGARRRHHDRRRGPARTSTRWSIRPGTSVLPREPRTCRLTRERAGSERAAGSPTATQSAAACARRWRCMPP